MSMTSMKRNKADKKKHSGSMAVDVPGREDYPWGLSITLEKESLEKLGVDVESFSVGQTGKITVMVEVVGVSRSASKGSKDDNEQQDVRLQITDLDIAGLAKAKKTGAYQDYAKTRDKVGGVI